MAGTLSSDEVFAKIFENPENQKCFECGLPSNQWASVTNGIVLCLNCSGLHRGLGVSVSFVRSITMDTWNEKQLKMMLNGGNTQMKEFFEVYGIRRDTGIIGDKYKTKAAYFYRERLKAVVDGTPEPVAPSIEEGQEIVNSAPKLQYNPNEKPPVSPPPVAPKEEEKKQAEESVTTKLTSGWGAFTGWVSQATKNVTEKVNQQLSDPKFQEDWKQFKDKVAQTTSVATQSLEKGVGEMVEFMKTQGAVKKPAPGAGPAPNYEPPKEAPKPDEQIAQIAAPAKPEEPKPQAAPAPAAGIYPKLDEPHPTNNNA